MRGKEEGERGGGRERGEEGGKGEGEKGEGRKGRFLVSILLEGGWYTHQAGRAEASSESEVYSSCCCCCCCWALSLTWMLNAPVGSLVPGIGMHELHPAIQPGSYRVAFPALPILFLQAR